MVTVRGGDANDDLVRLGNDCCSQSKWKERKGLEQPVTRHGQAMGMTDLGQQQFICLVICAEANGSPLQVISWGAQSAPFRLL